MPERDNYPEEYFSGNPFEGKDAFEVYRELRWDNDWNEAFELDAPEPMASIGELARLELDNDIFEWSENEAPFLAVGVDSNALYIIPQDSDGNPVDVPTGEYQVIGEVVQTDYYSDKGNEDAYFYHEHEFPYPILAVHPESGVSVILPQANDGRRSFAVSREGIIG